MCCGVVRLPLSLSCVLGSSVKIVFNWIYNSVHIQAREKYFVIIILNESPCAHRKYFLRFGKPLVERHHGYGSEMRYQVDIYSIDMKYFLWIYQTAILGYCIVTALPYPPTVGKWISKNYSAQQIFNLLYPNLDIYFEYSRREHLGNKYLFT